MAALREYKIKAPRDRVRLIIRTVDRGPDHGAFKQACVRRVYKVPWINALWHIDGHHKLIDYKIVIHGCIDGFSRSIIYLAAKDNNRADTVRELFSNGTRRSGWPSRVRGDYGKENMGVKQAMESVRVEWHFKYLSRCPSEFFHQVSIGAPSYKAPPLATSA